MSELLVLDICFKNVSNILFVYNYSKNVIEFVSIYYINFN